MVNYDIYYHVCKYPIDMKYYNVRKFIINKDNGVIDRCENYHYSKRNINKLKKEINLHNYEHIYIDNNNFENIPYPLTNIISNK